MNKATLIFTTFAMHNKPWKQIDSNFGICTFHINIYYPMCLSFFLLLSYYEEEYVVIMKLMLRLQN